MRSPVLLVMALMCVALTSACGKTGDLYLPGDSSGDSSDEKESLEKAAGDGVSSKTDSTTGR